MCWESNPVLQACFLYGLDTACKQKSHTPAYLTKALHLNHNDNLTILHYALRTVRNRRRSVRQAPVRRSNSQPCQGQAKISPSRPHIHSPGCEGRVVPPTRPRQTGANSVRQTFRMATKPPYAEKPNGSPFNLNDLSFARRDLIDRATAVAACPRPAMLLRVPHRVCEASPSGWAVV